MLNSGQCPKCGKIPSSVNAETITVSANITTQWNGVSYVCPFCRTILGGSIDPVALKADLRDEIAQILGR